MLYILAALLIALMALVILLLIRQGQVNQAQLDPGETDKIVAALSSNLTRVQGEIQKTGIEQLSHLAMDHAHIVSQARVGTAKPRSDSYELASVSQTRSSKSRWGLSCG